MYVHVCRYICTYSHVYICIYIYMHLHTLQNMNRFQGNSLNSSSHGSSISDILIVTACELVDVAFTLAPLTAFAAALACAARSCGHLPPRVARL